MTKFKINTNFVIYNYMVSRGGDQLSIKNHSHRVLNWPVEAKS